MLFVQTEKVDLENTVVDESQRQLKEVGQSSRSNQEKYSGKSNALKTCSVNSSDLLSYDFSLQLWLYTI